MAGGENDDLAAEVDKLHRLLDQSSNYVADDAARPQVMQFNNGRTVRIIADADGSYLDTDFVPPKEIPQPPPTQDELQALENLKNSDFIPRLLAGEFDTI